MKFFRHIRALFQRRKLDADMAEEMRLHLDLQAERNRAAGMNAVEAEYAARREFGNVAGIQERARENRGWIWLEQGGQDLRYAARQLRRNPGFATVAVLSLALGIGANTTIFSLVNEVLLKTLPVKNPHELVLFSWLSGPKGLDLPVSGSWDTDPATGLTSCTSFSQEAFEHFRDDNQTLASVFAFAPLREPTLIVDGEAEVSTYGAQFVSGNYHEGLGVASWLGRTIEPGDDRPDATPVAVISHPFWQRRFGGNPGALGKTVTINGVPVTIVGVTPPAFHGALDVGVTPDISIPLALMPAVDADFSALMKRVDGLWWLRVMGRRKAGATAEQVQGNLAEVFRQLARDDLSARVARAGTSGNDSPELPQLAIRSGERGLTGGRQAQRPRLLILAGLVGLVLLIASANVANLMLARGAARRREIAARLALGASRGRLIRQLLTESGLLVLLGAGGALLLAFWGQGVLPAMNLLVTEGPQSLLVSPELDWRVLGFTALVALGAGAAFGVAPALRATRIDLSREFQGAGRGGAGGSRSWLARSLLVAQVALSLVLLAGAGLFVRTLQNLGKIDAGFNREQLLLFRVTAKPPAYDPSRAAALHRQIAERIATIPGVKGATYSRMPLLSQAGWGTNVRIPGRNAPPDRPDFAMLNAVQPDFFATLGIPILLGRALTERDDAQAPKVALINETMVRRYFNGGNPIGRRIGRRGPKGEVEAEIVGVVRDAKYTELKNEIPPTVYYPFSQEADGEANYAVRAAGDPEMLAPRILQVVREIDPTLPLADVRTQEMQVEKLYAGERLFARFAGFFGLLAFTLVGVGLYGLLSYAVTRRTSEIGVRVALGAEPGHISWLILRESLFLVGGGLLLGLAAAAALTRFIGTMLYGVTPMDPLTLGAVCLILLAAAVLAAWLPAWRAAKVDPVIALRAE